MNLTTLQLQRAIRSITDPWQWRPDSATAALAIRRRVETPAGIAPTLTRRDGLGRSAVGTDLKALASLTGPGAAPMRSETAVTTATYQTRKYRLEELIPDEVAQASNQVMLDAIGAAARRLQAHLLRDLDQLLIRQLLTKSLWPAAGVATLTTGASGTSWASHTSANSDPLGNLRAARSYIALTTGRPATHIALTADVLDHLADHPAIGGALKYTDPGAIIKEGPGAIKGLTLVPITTAYDSTPAATDPTPAVQGQDRRPLLRNRLRPWRRLRTGNLLRRPRAHIGPPRRQLPHLPRRDGRSLHRRCGNPGRHAAQRDRRHRRPTRRLRDLVRYRLRSHQT